MTVALPAALLVFVYVLALASIEPWDVAIGAVLAAAVLTWARRALFTGGTVGTRCLLRRAALFPFFALAVAREVVVGTWQVALVVVGVRPLARPGIVAVPIGDRTASGVSALGLALTLSPGEVLVDIDWRRRVMLVHVIDASDPAAVRARHERFYSRYQRAVFP